MAKDPTQKVSVCRVCTFGVITMSAWDKKRHQTQLLTKSTSSDEVVDLEALAGGDWLLLSRINKNQAALDPHMFQGETSMCQSLCFEKELELLGQHEPQPYPTSDELLVIRAVQVTRGSNDALTMTLLGVVYLEDANSAMARYGKNNFYRGHRKMEYSGLYLSGLCRLGTTKGLGKELLDYCIGCARSCEKKLYLSIFNANEESIKRSHDRLFTYYCSNGFSWHNEYIFKGGELKYTIMVNK